MLSEQGQACILFALGIALYLVFCLARFHARFCGRLGIVPVKPVFGKGSDSISGRLWATGKYYQSAVL